MQTRFRLPPGALPHNAALASWRRNMYFVNIRNTTLFKYTQGGFPANAPMGKRDTHAIFVLDQKADSLEICPCSSSNWEIEQSRRYIVGGAVTDIQKVIQKTTYLISEHSFQLPYSISETIIFAQDFTNMQLPDVAPLIYWGKVHKRDIREE